MTARPSLARVAEVAVIAVLLVGTAWLGKLMHHNYVEHPDARLESLNSAPELIPARGADGTSDSVLIDGDRPLMLYLLSVDCPFCEQNMSEWRELSSAVGALGTAAPRILVLSLSERDETEAFLAAHGLEAEVRYIDRGVLPLLGVRGYPTTLAIDPATRDLRTWSGVLRTGDHEAIRAWASSSRRGASESGAGGP